MTELYVDQVALFLVNQLVVHNFIALHFLLVKYGHLEKERSHTLFQK